MGDDTSQIIEFETSSKAFTVESDKHLAFRITNKSGQEYDIITDAYTFIVKPKPLEIVFQPSIYSVQPKVGEISGGTDITITGFDFGHQQGHGQVMFGNIPTSQIKEWSNTKIVCVSPEHVRAFVTINVTTDTQLTGSKKKAFLFYEHHIYVGPEETITSIQEAIFTVNDGLTIVVKDGQYTENIVVNKSLTIVSKSGWENTTIVAKDSKKHVVDIVANNTTIQGFSIYGAEEKSMAGINVMADNCKILDNVCGTNQDKNNTIGIRLNKTTDTHLYGLMNNFISGNQCYYSTYGIYIQSVTHNIIQNNLISFCNEKGLYLEHSDKNIINNNIFSDNKNTGAYFSFSHQNILSDNIFEENNEYGILMDHSVKNRIYLNSFINNQHSVQSTPDYSNKWFSAAPLYYEYNNKSYKNFIGNYFSEHDLTDTDQNGITNDYVSLPYNENMDKTPLSMPQDHYITHIWHLTDKHLLENQIFFNNTIVRINNNNSHLWTTISPLKTDLVFNQENLWSGQLCLTSIPSQNAAFKIDIGVSETGNDFVSYGQVEINSFENNSAMPFFCHVPDFTIHKGKYMAIQITNLSASDYEIQTGSFNTFISKPAIENQPDIIQLEPEICTTSGNIQVIIKGSGFGKQQGAQKVMFGDVEAVSYNSWTPVQIICTAPPHPAERLNVWINKDEQSTYAGSVYRWFTFKDNVLFVGEQSMYPSIQYAINDASYSDTIIVNNGVYKENIYINKPLNISSANGYETTTIIPFDSFSSIVLLNHDNCLINGFTIYGFESTYSYRGAIQVNSDYCSISNNRIGIDEHQTNTKGIMLFYSNHTQIKKNLLNFNNFGMDLTRSDNNIIIDNVCLYNNYGISFSFSEKNIVATNSCQNNKYYGIRIGSQFNIIYDNQLNSNGENGIELGTGKNLVIQNDIQMNGENGIYLYGNSNIIFDNTIQYNNENVFSTGQSNCFHSPIQLHYTYNDHLFFNYSGNKFAPFFSYDQNSDGLYDESYFIPENSNDPFPLYQTPDNYNYHISTLLTDSRMVKEFTEKSGQITIEPNATHIWKAGADAIKLTGTSQWMGQLITGNALPDGHILKIIAGYVDSENTFIPAGTGSLITGDGSEKYFTTQSSITPLENSPEKALAIQIENYSSEVINILTGGAWSFFSFRQEDSNQSPVADSFEITASAGNHGRIIPQGTIIVQAFDDQGFQFKPDTGYTIDQILIDNEAIQEMMPEFIFNNIKENHRIDVTFKASDALPPENVTVIPKTEGVIIKWIDKTISNEVVGYQVYRSKFQNGHFLLIDPVVMNRELIGENIWYQAFDTFDPMDIQRKSTFWYSIAAIISDSSISRLSPPAAGQALITEGGLFHLIPVQKEMEAKPGESVTFDIYVIAEGDFQDWVELTASYPPSQSIPDAVSWEFTENKVKPLASFAFKIKFGYSALQGTYDIDVSANGGGRNDMISLRFSIVYEDENNGFISAHVKQKEVMHKEINDINGHLNVRKDDWIDIYGQMIPSKIDMPVDIIIQYETQPYTILHITGYSNGEYLQSFSPEKIGTYTIHSQYVNQYNHIVKSQAISFSARKNNKSEIRCNTGNQEIETGNTVTIYFHLYPEIEKTPILFQIFEPDNTIKTDQCTTDPRGECEYNISLTKTGIWEIQSWWEGNLDYEGQYSKSLYLYPGIESPRALIIAGGGIQDNALSETTQYLADRFYRLLINRHLNDNFIYYMSSVTNELNDRVDDIYLTEQSVAEYLTDLYQDGPPYLVNEKTPLIIYMVDHGGNDLFKLNKKAFLSADALNHSLDLLQQKTNCEIQIIIDACYAGSFIDDLSHENSQNRIIITATGENAPAYYDQEGRESFSSHLFNYLIQGFSLGDCYSYARKKLWEKSYLYQNQIPQINDLYSATQTYLGGTFITGDFLPEFIDRTPNQIIFDRTLTINATVVDIEDEICTVWASILPPNHHVPSFNDFSSPQWQLERINFFSKPDQKNVYESTYNCFYQKGLYVVNIYAQDSSGNVSNEELLLTVKESQLPLGWGDLDNNDVINLKDAIIALTIFSKLPLSTVDINDQFCSHSISLGEVIFILQVIVN